MRKWKVKLPGRRTFTLESDTPGQELIAQGHTAFALEELAPPPVAADIELPEGKLNLSVEEAAEALGISRHGVYDLVHRADFPSYKIGGRRVISRRLLADWVDAQAQMKAEV